MYTFLAIIFAISYQLCMIWAIVSFILYLAKDIPFNWLSVFGIGVSLVLTIIFYFLDN